MRVADMHCDTISELYKARGREGLQASRLKVDIEKMRRGGYLLQNFAIFTDIREDGGYPYECAKNQIALFYDEMKKNEKEICPVRTIKEIEKNLDEGRISAVLTMEEGEICGGSLAKLEEFYRAGVRMMTFTWNYDNSLGNWQGLTQTGILFLERMEELGMIPDVSHLSDAGILDVCRYAKKPFAASHSNARALCGHQRNLTDEMIRMIAERGGVIGVNYYGMFLEEKGADGICRSRVRRIAEHILHMVHVGGLSCVGLGSDFDGFSGGSEISDCSDMGLLWEELKRQGMVEREIEYVFWRNVLRIYGDCWRA